MILKAPQGQRAYIYHSWDVHCSLYQQQRLVASDKPCLCSELLERKAAWWVSGFSKAVPIDVAWIVGRTGEGEAILLAY